VNRALTVDDLVVAAVALVAGLLAAFLLRILMRWLGKHAGRTRWSGDDVIVDALRTVVPWAAIAGGAAAVATAVDTFGRIDVVVNGAGIMRLSPIRDGDVELFDQVIATNLRGAFLVLSEAARRVSPGGRIIAVSSSVVARVFPTYGAYIAAEAGVEGLVHVLANELRGRDITVNAVAPGPVATELFLSGKTAEEVARLAKLPPLERLGEPEDIARAVAFLAGPDGGWVNGQVLRVNGGFA
jgi:3-oxoacyl-[acyl-carrier protein] reductase